MLGVSQSTAEADWTYAKAWLKREIEDQILKNPSVGFARQDGALEAGRRDPVNESQIFADALKLATPQERAAYLDRVCCGRLPARAPRSRPCCMPTPAIRTSSNSPLVRSGQRWTCQQARGLPGENR